jgi:integrase
MLTLAKYRNARLKQVSGSTVTRELALLSHLFSTALEDWSIAVDNPISSIRKPKQNAKRTRRLEGDEEARLLAAAAHSPAKGMPLIIKLAIETGIRAGNLVMLERSQIDLKRKVIKLALTKNGSLLEVPMSPVAFAALSRVGRVPSRKRTGGCLNFTIPTVFLWLLDVFAGPQRLSVTNTVILTH